ncbi:MAG: signal recognition particle-docking protein FtsY, partial [candidate division Zixibacteria bacterium]|nr:signal recognition particle-docking protein FtsY [candidate division Zixibacteria bacterium]
MANPFDKLKKSLSRTKDNLFGKISAVLGREKISDDLLDDIEEILIEADIGVQASARLIERLRESVSENRVTDADDIFTLLKNEIATMLGELKQSSAVDSNASPVVWLIVGVNGVGKTTTIGKLATLFATEGKKTMIAACDTFRAAAIDQISIWAERSGVEIIKSQEGADPAAVAFDAAAAARARNADILLVDTAGRLHTKSNLMAELEKIKRVMTKALPDCPIHTRLILDGTTGQNALSQVSVFTEAVGCDGLI